MRPLSLEGQISAHLAASGQIYDLELHDCSSAVEECVGILRQAPSGLKNEKSARAKFSRSFQFSLVALVRVSYDARLFERIYIFTDRCFTHNKLIMGIRR